MTAEEIARLRALCEKATEAPWSYYAADEETPSREDIVYSGGHPTFTGSFSVGEMHHPEDRAFIAAARSALPRALDEIERLRAELAMIVKYASEDRAVTPGFTRLARALNKVSTTLGLDPDAGRK